jgi:hypothetical protein
MRNQKTPLREKSTSASCNSDSKTSIILLSSRLTLHTRRIGKPFEIIPLRGIVSSTLYPLSTSYLDAFHVLMMIGGVMFFLSFLLRRQEAKKPTMTA